MDAFYTRQGEGFHCGKSAYFIRLGGCDVGCHWCDTVNSWEAEAHPVIPVNEIVEMAAAQLSKLAVVTGGEPAMYNLRPLTELLNKKVIKTHIETSGAYPLSGNWDWVCLSPKKARPPVEDVLLKANELKVIIYNNADFRWAEEQAKRVGSGCLLYLQPEWSRAMKNMPTILSYMQVYPQWGLSLQAHKYAGIP